MIVIKNDFLNITKCHNFAGKGITSPCYATLENGKNVYLKYPNNTEGNLVLINEWISASIADLVKLNIPKYGACYLCESVIQEAKFLDVNNQGLCFFSEEIRDVFPLTTPGVFKKYINSDAEFLKLLLFDHIIYNKDRNRGNLLLAGYTDEKQIFVIDHSHVFKNEVIWDKYAFSQGMVSQDYLDQNILDANKGTYLFFSDSVTINHENLLRETDHFKSVLTKEAIRDIFSSIPYDFSLLSPHLAELEEYINYRIDHIDEISTVIYNYYKGV